MNDDPAKAGEMPGGPIVAMTAGTLQGIRVPRIFSAEEMARVAERLPTAGIARYPLLFGEPPVVSYGRMLAPTTPEPAGPPFADYLAAAAAHEPLLDALIPGLRDRIAVVLGILAGGVQARVPSHGGASYATATIREVPGGRDLPLHNDTYRPSPAWAHLDAIRDTTTRLSWYVGIDAPEAGGELLVAGEPLQVGVGDMVVFDAGRLSHTVTAVIGTKPRHTLGGFCSFDRGREALWFWG
jgi:hypothetical protein